VKAVVMGCGRVGARVATVLDQNGHDVTVIDTQSRAFRRLPADFSGQTIIGTGIDEDTLRAAGIEEAAAFVAVTNGDNRNIMASQVCQKIFNVPRVVCRIYDPVREQTYRNLGLSTVCPTTLISAQVLDQVLTADEAPLARATEG
jgi:trk system potassium uptake protein TrkA